MTALKLLGVETGKGDDTFGRAPAGGRRPPAMKEDENGQDRFAAHARDGAQQPRFCLKVGVVF